MIFRRVICARISSGPRIQPIRRPPQKSFDSEPIVRIGANGSKAAMGGGGGVLPDRERSARVLSSTIAMRISRARRASARRPDSGMTAPVGL